MKRAAGKSHCPINFTLEILGDQWSLLVMRDMLLYGKRRYKDFLESDEKIATNILSNRLATLEENGVIEKMCEQYLPTQKGLELLPLLTEMALWGSRFDVKTAAPKDFARWARNDPERFRKEVKGLAKENSSLS